MHSYRGGIIVHTGPMFGGKTSGLLADVRKMRIAGYNVALFKPTMDDRYSKQYVMNHDGESIEAIRVTNVEEINAYLEEHPEINVIAIDEYQFLKSDSYTVMESLLWHVYDEGKTIMVSGLNLDSELYSFKNMKDILPHATHIINHKAVCIDCGSDATTSFCNVDKIEKELVGGKETYSPLCIPCYMKRRKANG